MRLRIREVRQRCRLTQAALDELYGLHSTFVGTLERGTSNASLLNLQKIARVLRTTPSKLLE